MDGDGRGCRDDGRLQHTLRASRAAEEGARRPARRAERGAADPDGALLRAPPDRGARPGRRRAGPPRARAPPARRRPFDPELGRAAAVRRSPTRRAPAPRARARPCRSRVVSREAVAYVLRMFPQASETFVANEILALERLGLPIRVYSYRRPD